MTDTKSLWENRGKIMSAGMAARPALPPVQRELLRQAPLLIETMPESEVRAFREAIEPDRETVAESKPRAARRAKAPSRSSSLLEGWRPRPSTVEAVRGRTRALAELANEPPCTCTGVGAEEQYCPPCKAAFAD